jgi:hypothetical protein
MGHLGFRTSSPSRENGFAGPAKLFRGAGGRNGFTQSRSAVRTVRLSPTPLLKGVTVLLLHLRDVLVVAEHPV